MADVQQLGELGRTGSVDEPTLHWRGLREDESALMIKALRSSRVDLISDLLRALDLW